MAPPPGSERALGSQHRAIDLPPAPHALRPASVPFVTTLVLCIVVACLLAFIAWR
ncbi:MAG: hypothetical protein JNK02_11155 [Planctomycetes bacterium]|nr:hypothetical protein [Planctomycetota bacterium]